MEHKSNNVFSNANPLGGKFEFHSVVNKLLENGGLVIDHVSHVAKEVKLTAVANFDGECVALWVDKENFLLYPVGLDLTGWPHIYREHRGGLVDVAAHGGLLNAIKKYNELELSIDVPGHKHRLIKDALEL